MGSPYSDLFISYQPTDLAFAEQIYQRLKDAGIAVWFDKVRLQPLHTLSNIRQIDASANTAPSLATCRDVLLGWG
jgi:TIR domain